MGQLPFRRNGTNWPMPDPMVSRTLAGMYARLTDRTYWVSRLDPSKNALPPQPFETLDAAREAVIEQSNTLDGYWAIRHRGEVVGIARNGQYL